MYISLNNINQKLNPSSLTLINLSIDLHLQHDDKLGKEEGFKESKTENLHISPLTSQELLPWDLHHFLCFHSQASMQIALLI